jgi:hypothetical protein
VIAQLACILLVMALGTALAVPENSAGAALRGSAPQQSASVVSAPAELLAGAWRWFEDLQTSAALALS